MKYPITPTRPIKRMDPATFVSFGGAIMVSMAVFASAFSHYYYRKSHKQMLENWETQSEISREYKRMFEKSHADRAMLIKALNESVERNKALREMLLKQKK